jgi:hypothetical protein
MIESEAFPGAQHDSDDALWELFRRLSLCGTHAVATCRMGSDNSAVRDPDLRCRACAGLRVVDCSAMPAPISGNTNAAAMASPGPRPIASARRHDEGDGHDRRVAGNSGAGDGALRRQGSGAATGAGWRRKAPPCG